ncbi:acyl-CoA dehydrogenase family protein [Bradyrhizobium icense]|uniref:acyl-CoA dehydrogenase family protein n=1 Tax=Bradyrhizobium icense TaxID=1274631 RepID=UPI000ABD2358|nr:acyl-CoA dehydrogenase family protein [Bradyrhizobium icense]
MDLAFTKEEQAFREEVRQFLRDNVPPEMRRKRLKAGRYRGMRWSQAHASSTKWAFRIGLMNMEGRVDPYATLHFRRRGAGVSHIVSNFGVSLVGPVIYTFGNEAQKKYYLPRILNVEDWWCQGFSEPGAGSDLASLKTRAVRIGDHYLVNGQKIWTTAAQYANWIFCLVRTNPDVKKQQGISFLLIDMKTPGVTVRPIQLINGGHEVNEVFFSDVRVPIENLVGEENKGWEYAKFLLGNERFSDSSVGNSKERIRRIKELAARCFAGGERLLDQAAFREKLSAVEVQLKAIEITQLQVIANASKQQKSADPASPILKLRGSEIEQATAELLMDVVGPYALPYFSEEELESGNEQPIGPDWAATIAPAYFYSRAASFYPGSSEIQKNIIAKEILGL